MWYPSGGGFWLRDIAASNGLKGGASDGARAAPNECPGLEIRPVVFGLKSALSAGVSRYPRQNLSGLSVINKKLGRNGGCSATRPGGPALTAHCAARERSKLRAAEAASGGTAWRPVLAVAASLPPPRRRRCAVEHRAPARAARRPPGPPRGARARSCPRPRRCHLGDARDRARERLLELVARVRSARACGAGPQLLARGGHARGGGGRNLELDVCARRARPRRRGAFGRAVALGAELGARAELGLSAAQRPSSASCAAGLRVSASSRSPSARVALASAARARARARCARRRARPSPPRARARAGPRGAAAARRAASRPPLRPRAAPARGCARRARASFFERGDARGRLLAIARGGELVLEQPFSSRSLACTPPAAPSAKRSPRTPPSAPSTRMRARRRARRRSRAAPRSARLGRRRRRPRGEELLCHTKRPLHLASRPVAHRRTLEAQPRAHAASSVVASPSAGPRRRRPRRALRRAARAWARPSADEVTSTLVDVSTAMTCTGGASGEPGSPASACRLRPTSRSRSDLSPRAASDSGAFVSARGQRSRFGSKLAPR